MPGRNIAVLAVAAFVAATSRAIQPPFFGIIIAGFGLMVAVHAWVAVRRIQPRTESLETFAWLLC